MGRGFQDQLVVLGKQVRAAAISGDWEHTSDCCFEQLPALYEKFCSTNESRYGEEISRRVQQVLNELASNARDCAEARRLSAHITDRLHLLHERFGLPGFAIRSGEEGQGTSTLRAGRPGRAERLDPAGPFPGPTPQTAGAKRVVQRPTALELRG
jgi:hypothetical protein